MDTPSVIRDFLDENRVGATRSVEIAYRYHAELESGCRLSGCEMTMRAVGEEVLVRAELPVNVMPKESCGVVKYLADLNKKRVGEGKQGYFDLDYVAGRIVFAIRVRQPITTELLKEVARYCIDQIEYESDDLLKAVCDECESVLQEEEELRQEREKEFADPNPFASLIRRLKDLLGVSSEPSPRRKRARRGMPAHDPFDESGYDYDYEYAEEDDDEVYGSYSGSRKPYSRLHRTYRPKATGFESDDDDGDDESYVPYSGLNRRSSIFESDDEPEDKETEKRYGDLFEDERDEPAKGPDEDDEDEDQPDEPGMTQDEFEEFLNRHIYREPDPDDEPEEYEGEFSPSVPAQEDDEDEDNIIYLGPVEEKPSGDAEKAKEDKKEE